MLRSYKYRIYPTGDQIKLIEQTFSACRLVYNLALEVKISAYKQHQINLSAFSLCRQLVELKRDHEWLHEVDSQALVASVIRIESAFKNFFRNAGYPKFKSKKGIQSFQCSYKGRKIDFNNELLTITKIKNIPIRISRKFEGKVKRIIISRVPSGKYFVSILVDNEIHQPTKAPIDIQKTIGIDLGLKDLAILSDGTKFTNPKFLKLSQQRLAVLQKRVCRKKKGSGNRKKAVKRVAIQHERIANQRKDYLQKISTKLVRDNQTTTFCVESLSVKTLVKNHRLAQAITDAAWSMFVKMLQYKCLWNGKSVIEIGTFEPSTKTCSTCKVINEEITLEDRNWTCVSCHATHDRDVNAAINIKFMGLEKSRRGTSEGPVESRRLRRAKKQEVIVDG